MGLMPPIIAEVKADISNFSAKLDEVEARVSKMAKNGASEFAQFKTHLGGYMLAAGTFATVAGAALEHLGQQAERSKVQLETAVKNAGYNFDQFKKQIDSTVDSQAKFGHGVADTNEALAKLTTATQDPTQALKDMQLAADIAAVKHTSLADASDIVVKAMAGSAKAFRQFGIDVKTTADPMDELQRRLSGQAAAAADTFGGKVDALRTHVLNFASAVGEKVGPALVTAGPLLMGIGTIAQTVGPKIAALISTMGPWVAVAGLAAGAIYLLTRNNDEFTFSIDTVRNLSLPDLTKKMEAYRQKIDDSVKLQSLHTQLVKETAQQWNDEFSKILTTAPELAQKFADAAKSAGQDTSGWNDRIREVTAQTIAAKDAQDLWNQKLAAEKEAAKNAKDATKEAADAMAKLVDQTQKAVSTGFNPLVDSLGGFADKHKVTAKQIESTWIDNVKSAQNWSNDLTSLMNAGVNQGLVDQIAQGGPKMDAAAKGILDLVKQKGVTYVNNLSEWAGTIEDTTLAAAKRFVEGLKKIWDGPDMDFMVGRARILAGTVPQPDPNYQGGGRPRSTLIDGGYDISPGLSGARGVPTRGGVVPFANYTINVNVAPTADKVEVGREIVSTIRAYERVNSSAWRQGGISS